MRKTRYSKDCKRDSGDGGGTGLSRRWLKRVFDFTMSSMALLLLGSLMLIIALIVKLESEGPILFRQHRIGQNNKSFYIYKFRSMYLNAPNVATDRLTNPDQYITKIGRFLRKSSLDELPQLFNVIKGEMSIVGPRPALYNQYTLIEMRSIRNIHTIKPGVTGYAQISGRDSISDDDKVRFDLEYLNNSTFMFDVKIIIITFFKVFKVSDIKA